MKKLIGSDFGYYIFDPANKQLTIYDTPTFTPDQLLLITNTTAGIMLYNFAVPALGATVNGKVITLEIDTTAMSTTDSLQIFIDFPVAAAPIETPPTPDDLFIEPQDQIPQSVYPCFAGGRTRAQAMPMVLADEQFLDLIGNPVSFRFPLAGTQVLFQDCLQYRQVSLEIHCDTGISGGLLTFETSNSLDNSLTWSQCPLVNTNNPYALTPYGTVNTLPGSVIFLTGMIPGRYFRVRVTTSVSGGTLGNITLIPIFRMQPPTSYYVAANLTQWGGTNVTAGAAPPVNIANIGGTANAAAAGNIAVGASATGGALISRIVAAASTNLTQAKSGQGKLYGYSISNTTASAFYVKFYNILSGSVTVGTSAIIMTLYVPASTTISGQFSADLGLDCSTAISYATTANAADNDTTVIGAGPLIQIIYK